METNSTTGSTPATPTTKTEYVPMDKYIADAKIALANAALPDIAPLLARRSYPATIITAKQAELATLEGLVLAQVKEYGEQYEATKKYNDAIAALYSDYIEHIELARMKFKNDTAAKTTLGLKGKRKESQSGITAQGLQFYKGVLDNADYTAAMDSKGVDVAELQAAKAGFENLTNLAAAQAKETGEAQEATAKRDEAYDNFKEWMDEFLATATIALRKSPQMMEKMGLVQG
jgi:hypothetical protein